MKRIAPESAHIGLFFVAVGGLVVLFSWALFILLPFSWFIILALPPSLLVMWQLSRTAYRKGWRVYWCLRQYWLFGIIVLLLVLLAPLYSYLYGYYHVSRLANELNIEAELMEREVVLIDRLNWFVYSAPIRSFTLQYQVQEPLEEVEAHIQQLFANHSDWYVGGPNPNAITLNRAPILIQARCPASRPFRGTGVALRENGHLSVQFSYEKPRWCIDISSN